MIANGVVEGAEEGTRFSNQQSYLPSI